MRKIFFIFYFLCEASFGGVEGKIEIMKNLGENPPATHLKKGQDAISKIKDGVKSKTHKVLSSDRKAQINSKLKALKNKINSKQHTLKLKNAAQKKILRKNKQSKKNKRTKKTKKMLKRLRGIRSN